MLVRDHICILIRLPLFSVYDAFALLKVGLLIKLSALTKCF